MTATPATITVWHNNRLDRQEELELAPLADRFQKSEWAAEKLPARRAVAGYLAVVEHVTWEDRDAFDALVDLIIERRRTA